MTPSILFLVVCLCLACFILGMIAMAILLHPHREEAKRLRKRQAEYQRHQEQLRRINK